MWKNYIYLHISNFCRLVLGYYLAVLVLVSVDTDGIPKVMMSIDEYKNA